MARSKWKKCRTSPRVGDSVSMYTAKSHGVGDHVTSHDKCRYRVVKMTSKTSGKVVAATNLRRDVYNALLKMKQNQRACVMDKGFVDSWNCDRAWFLAGEYE